MRLLKAALRRRVRDHEDGGALLVELEQHLHDLVAVLGVEVARGLVGQDQVRLVDQRARHGHALLLAARELRREVVAAVGDIHLLEHRLDARAALVRRRLP